MTEVDSHSKGKSLHNILTPITIGIICVFLTTEIRFMDMNRKISENVDLQQSFDMRRERFPLI